MAHHSRKRQLLRAAVLALVLVLVPALAAAQSSPARRTKRSDLSTRSSSEVGSLYYGAGIGLAIPFESGMHAGFKLDVNGFYVMQRLNPGLFLDLGANVGFTYNGSSVPDVSSWVLDLLPTARLRYQIDPAFSVYGDGGLGFAVWHWSAPSVTIGGITFGGSNTSLDLMLKLGGGVAYKVSPQVALFFEPAFNVYITDTTEFTMMVGAQYRP